MKFAQYLIPMSGLLAANLFWGAFATAQDTKTEAEPQENQPAASSTSSAPMPPSMPPSMPPQPLPEEVPAARKSLLSSAETKDFNKGMYFDQVNNGLILPPLELDYELGADGQRLRIGNITLDEHSFAFRLMPLAKSHSQLKRVLQTGQGEKLVLLMNWPEALLSSGNLEVISKTGAVLWQTQISPSARKAWLDRLDIWRKTLTVSGVAAKDVARTGIFSTQFGILEVAKSGFFAKIKESFRFCLSSNESRNSTKLCSRRYAIQKGPQGMMMEPLRVEAANPRILLGNEDAPKAQSVAVEMENPTSFYAELATGESYEFVAAPNKLQLMDIADTKNPKILRIVGYDTRPVGPSVILNEVQYGALTKLLGFQATIGDPRKFWAAGILVQEPKIFLPGKGGGIFKQRFELSQIPQRQSRLYLHRRTPEGTYIDGIVLEGRKPSTAQVTSTENSVELDSKDPDHFYWSFKASERGAINRAYLDESLDGKNYRSYFELYKGYPRELSGRLSAVGASGSFLFLSEIAYNQWFEDLFGWRDYYLSRQRWGLSAKYFQSLNKLNLDASGQSAPMSVITADLKYRLSPGLWNRDESVGLMGSYQQVSFDQLKAPMMGVGAFWARSMPKVFDDLFDFSFLKPYPKWVDMEFIYYVSSLDSKVTLDSSMSLNFHGKVLWTKSIFGEMGFGYKRYAFSDSSLNQKAAINMFYGTAGLGINF